MPMDPNHLAFYQPHCHHITIQSGDLRSAQPLLGRLWASDLPTWRGELERVENFSSEDVDVITGEHNPQTTVHD